ncbi:MAG: DUF547 domain-containing protein [Cyanobacteria bacterium J06560_2]
MQMRYLKKKYLLLAVAPALIGLGGCLFISSQAEADSAVAQIETAQGETTTAASEVNTAALADVLATYVDEQGLVDYDSLQANRQQLDAYNASIQLTSQASFDSWSEPEQIAFLINAYNSLTLKSIIDQSPIKDSIKDITGVWRFKKHGLLGAEQTLNNIEHDILRKNYNEPRIHAALVCAALSCPYLRQEPFTGDNLEAQLDDQVRIFLSRSEVLEIDAANGEVKLSSIFDWFTGDWATSFTPEEGFSGSDDERAVLNFISGYLDAADADYLKTGDYKIRYSDYDWSLNRPES